MLNPLKAPAMRALAPARRASAPRSALMRKAYSTAGPSAAKPRKRHPIRNFFLGSTLLLAAGYAGAVYYALQNDNFYYYFTAYVPLGSYVVDYVDDYMFKHMVSTRPHEEGSLMARHGVKHHESVLIDGNGKVNASTFASEPAKSKGLNEEAKEAVNDGKKAQKSSQKVRDTIKNSHSSTDELGLSSNKPANSEKKSKASTDSAPDVTKAVTAPAAAANSDGSGESDKHVIVLETVKPERVPSSVSSGDSPSAMDTKHLDPVLKDVSNAVNMCLRTGGVDLNSNSYFSTLVSTINTASRGIQQQKADLKHQYDESIKQVKDEVTKKADQEYLEAKLKLVESYNNRLQAALDAVTQRAVAASNNKIQAQYVELLRRFNHEINDKVETERDGRLGQLSELKKDLEVLQEAMLKSGTVLESEDGVVAFFVELANLQRALSKPQSVPLKPYLDSLTKALPSDPLVKSVVDAVPAIVKRHGVLSHSQLAARFQIIEPKIRRSSLVPPDAGVGAHLTSLAASHLLVPKQGFPEGNDVESIIARTNSFLQQGDITSAVAEVNSLQGWPKKLASDWLDEGRKRSELEFLVNVLSDEGRLWGISRK